MYHHIEKSISSLEKLNTTTTPNLNSIIVDYSTETNGDSTTTATTTNNNYDQQGGPAAIVANDKHVQDLTIWPPTSNQNALFDIENLINGNYNEQEGSEPTEEFDLIALAFRQSGYIQAKETPIIDYGTVQRQEQLTTKADEASDQDQSSMSTNEPIIDSLHDWDIKNLKAIKVHNFDAYDMWPNGNVRKVYSVTNEKARRHQSGWAMRNTNNHNPQLLKKSCLGVLVCSLGCSQNNGKAIFLRPAICDKARRKQCLRQCLTDGCNGNLVQRPCKGHGGYPVTHFWRFANGAVYFEAKGNHDHPRPTLKCIGNSSSSNESQPWSYENKPIDFIFSNEYPESPHLGLLSTDDYTIPQLTPREIKRKRKAAGSSQTKMSKEKYINNASTIDSMISNQNSTATPQIFDFNHIINQNNQLFVFHSAVHQENDEPLVHHQNPSTQQNCSDFEFLNHHHQAYDDDHQNHHIQHHISHQDNDVIMTQQLPINDVYFVGQTISSSPFDATNNIINYSMNDGNVDSVNPTKSSFISSDNNFKPIITRSLFVNDNSAEVSNTASAYANPIDWFNNANNNNNVDNSGQIYYPPSTEYIQNMDGNNNQAMFNQIALSSSSAQDLDTFSTSQYTSYSSSCESSDSQGNIFLYSNEQPNTPTDSFYTGGTGRGHHQSANETTTTTLFEQSINGNTTSNETSTTINNDNKTSSNDLTNVCNNAPIIVENDCTNEIEKSLPTFWKNIKVT